DGAIVLLDYGAEELDGPWNGPHGTLAAVRGHQNAVDPFEAPGTCDLSAFVDFTRIRAAAARAGLKEVAYRRQAEALGAWGFERVLARTLARARGDEDAVRIRLAAKSLLFGFEGFRVLELGPGDGNGTR
ncbi:MAG: SAM-dependent methyltransferase, partial [Thermoplasmata archaeon]|nr:SAM-dependent methyltransferase [Thermoplasmata archaeon]